MEKINVEQEAPKLCIKNHCLREFLLKNYGESVQTVKGIKKSKTPNDFCRRSRGGA